MSSDGLVPLLGRGALLKIHALENGVLSVLALDRDQGLLAAFFPFQFGLLRLPSRFFRLVIGKQAHLLEGGRLFLSLRDDVRRREIQPAHQQGLIDDLIEQGRDCL